MHTFRAPIKDRTRRWTGGVLAAAVLCLIAAGGAGAAPVYPLYYAFEIPPVLTGFELSASYERRAIYTGLLRGTLGGLPVEKSAFTYRPGASAGAGGGEFSLQTAAGAVEHGLILMTTDGRQITLLFLGTYLGARLQFHIVGLAKDFGTTAITSRGLADTSFASHADYLTAVTQGAAALAPAARAEAIAHANANPRLVSAYQRETGAP